MRSFDLIAKPYAALERICLSNTLEKARFTCLPFLTDRQRMLLIGDGDGRFSSAILAQNQALQIDSIDISPSMLALAKKRAAQNANRLNTIHANAFEHIYPESHYDCIGLHFSLDCFSQPEIESLLPKLEASLQAGGILAYSDFQEVTYWHRSAVWFLYKAFRLTTGLSAQSLPSVNWSNELRLRKRKEFAGKLVFSEVRQKFTAAD